MFFTVFVLPLEVRAWTINTKLSSRNNHPTGNAFPASFPFHLFYLQQVFQPVLVFGAIISIRGEMNMTLFRALAFYYGITPAL